MGLARDMENLPSSGSAKLPSSSHRLPTVSASDALQSLQAKGPRAVSTGLATLDAALSGHTIGASKKNGGLEFGKVTELWGPPGSGKTAFAAQTAATALQEDNAVVWIDCFSPVASSRIRDAILAAAEGQPCPQDGDSLRNLHHYTAPTVAHLLSLVVHPPGKFPPKQTTLLVIDGLSTIFDIAYPRHQTAYGSKTEAGKFAAGRRYGILGSCMAGLKKMAAVNDLAVLVITGCATRVRMGTGLGASLVPGVGGAEWESGVSNRLVLFRDYTVRKDKVTLDGSSRYIGIQKANGVTFGEEAEPGRILAFEIEVARLKALSHQASSPEGPTLAPAVTSPVKGRKRAHDEVADSDEEYGSEYGWVEGDEVAAEGFIDEAVLTEDVLASNAATENG